jgi:AcrR family transcriptional regulator
MESGTDFARKPRAVGPRREEILAAALKLFSEHGIHAVSTRQIASAVGISQPSLYAFFPSKQAIEAEVCVRAFDELTSRLTEDLEMLRRGSSDICGLGRIYVDFGLAHPDAYRLAFMAEKPDPVSTVSSSGDSILAAGLKSFYILREAVGLTLGAGLSPQELELLAQSLWTALHGLVSLLLARPLFPWCEQKRLIEYHIARVFAGVARKRSAK